MGLLFTPHTKETVLDWFKNYSAEEFARGGFRATQTVTLPEGPLVDFSHAIGKSITLVPNEYIN